MNVYPLQSSPISLLRTKYRLSREAAAERLGITLGYLKVLEMRSRTISPEVLEVIENLLGPSPQFVQTNIWEALEDLEKRGAVGEGQSEGLGER